ncbi:MAG: TonB-dependent receptor [Pseudomonadota bacterium]
MNVKRASALLAIPASTLTLMSAAIAQEEPIEEIVVKGIRGSLATAIDQKRNSDNLVEVIIAEDIGKLPDQNLAEVLENIPGIQITREAGVGNGVQIRGTNANRTEINGVSTVGSGAGRTGINFEDVSAAIIAGVEVTKSPEAKTIEGSVGGTINLQTIRPLELSDSLAVVRIQGEDSSLSTDGIQPRLAGTWGDNWSTDSGDFGVVISGSYTEQDVTAFRPRTDRDNFVGSASGAASAQPFDFLPIQFLVQDYDNFEYETINFAGSFEWAPNDSMTLYFDTIINDQERLQESSRVQASGVSDLRNFSVPDGFELVNFGSIDGENGGQNLGSIQAALFGTIPIETGGADPNLRLSTDTSSRVTESQIFRLGTDWERDRWSGRVEVSTSRSETDNPNFSTTLNFINPNAATNSSNENGTPFAYDLRGGLTFGIAFGAAGAPAPADLLNPANYVLRDVNIGQDTTENTEDAFLSDFSFDLQWKAISSVDFGYRYNKTTSTTDEVRSNTGIRQLAEAPTGDLFESILTTGPDNFDAADGRALFVRDFLLINPETANSDPGAVLDVINAAIVANNAITGATRPPISDPTSRTAAFFDVEETTSALYAQANFEVGMFRGNFGFRYVDTDLDSRGFRVTDGVSTPTSTSSSYEFFLPRINIVASPRDDLVLRLGWTKDIRRPNFDDLSTSFSFSTSPNPPVSLGNPALEPEEVDSLDISAEWYFAPAAVASIGYFRKERTGVFVRNDEDPIEDANGFRDITDPCEAGGIFNPIADPNVFAPPGTPPGVCVPTTQIINGTGETTQSGFEFAIQYDLSNFEEQLGWASGFGFLANYTIQDFDGGDNFLGPTSRADTVFTALGNPDVTLRQPLVDLSENAYNITVFYEKYDLSARLRYTWREAYRSTDFGSTTSFPWGFPVVQDDRGQLNGSISYNVTDNLNVGLEAINITESEVEQYCVNENALLCFQGLTDRRVTFGASYRF